MFFPLFLYQPNGIEVDVLIEKNQAFSTQDKTILDATFQAIVEFRVIPLDFPALPNVKELDALIEKNRAISTPEKTIITFQALVDIGVIPLDSSALVPSSLPIRVYGD
ncbi:hypothetical protein HOLleu_13636 [Holothuria leucospilota]|uniref:Uncharacterized protein n=1 Tax=Holothuria leucospilota TaxID=206669 RepID=A0A9Q1CC20_HOLLE|nr:hypothetical protein HOLleu_13636 [Holothuria leucospilota]